MADEPLQLDRKLYAQILDFKPRKSDLRRAAILDAAIACLASDGIDKTTVQEVARRAKMRRSHVMYYFSSQDSLVEAAVKLVVATGQEITVAHMTAAGDRPQERLRAHAEATFAWFERHRTHASVMLLLLYYGSCHPKYTALNSQIREAGESRLEGILLSGLPPKRRNRNARPAARTLRALLVGSLAHYFSSKSSLDYEAAKQETFEAMLQIAESFWRRGGRGG